MSIPLLGGRYKSLQNVTTFHHCIPHLGQAIVILSLRGLPASPSSRSLPGRVPQWCPSHSKSRVLRVAHEACLIRSPHRSSLTSITSQHSRHALGSSLCPLPGIFFQDLSLTSFRSLLRCHLLGRRVTQPLALLHTPTPMCSPS